jgi:DNA segregation ATPase FtsK/SpoIIIE-like protein
MARQTNGTRRRTTNGNGAKRGTTNRRATRQKHGPVLTPDQAREVWGVIYFLVAALCGISAYEPTAPALWVINHALHYLFGYAWFMPVIFLAARGIVMVWPRRNGKLAGLDVEGPALRSSFFAWAGVSLCLMGLLSIASHGWGGVLGNLVAQLSRLFGPGVTSVLLVLALFVGVLVTLRVGVGTALLSTVEGGRAAWRSRPERRPGDTNPKPGGQPLTLAERLRQRFAPDTLEPEPEPAPATVPDPVPAPAPATAPVPAAAAEDADAVTAELPLEDGEATPDQETAEAAALNRAGEAAVEDDEEDEAILRIRGEWDATPDVPWRSPTLALLDALSGSKQAAMQDEIKRNVKIIEGTLATFGVQARVIGVNSGPAVTQYELQPAAGVQVRKVVSLHNDISLALAASPLRIEAPIPGKSAIGIEVPNKEAQVVPLRLVAERAGLLGARMALGVALGTDTDGTARLADLAAMPHLLIAGATGQGKSVCLNATIASLLLRYSPYQVRLVMLDPKRVELQAYNGLPHLVVPVVVETPQAMAVLRWGVMEMERRYRVLAKAGVRNLAALNEKRAAWRTRPIPYIVVVIDELADLMMTAAGECEELVCRIAQLARAVGIHLVIATQRPSTDIITGLIKANVPSRIAFAVGSQVDSRVILDSVGAEKLLGRGDGLYQPVNASRPERMQFAYVSDGEIERLVQHWRAQGDPAFVDDAIDTAPLNAVDDGAPKGDRDRRLDPLFARAARAVAAEGAASVSLVQRKFNVGYSRAGRIVDQLAEHRVVGAYQGSKSREVLMNLPDVDELLEQLGLEG